jgi:hypothetical protein
LHSPFILDNADLTVGVQRYETALECTYRFRFLGDAYRKYRACVPMLIPVRKKRIGWIGWRGKLTDPLLRILISAAAESFFPSPSTDLPQLAALGGPLAIVGTGWIRTGKLRSISFNGNPGDENIQEALDIGDSSAFLMTRTKFSLGESHHGSSVKLTVVFLIGRQQFTSY